MIAKMLASGWAETIYEDDEARLLRIRPVKGEPPDEVKDDEPETPEEKKILDELEANDAKNANANEPDQDDPEP